MLFLLYFCLLIVSINCFNNFGNRLLNRPKFQLNLINDEDNLSTSNEDAEIPTSDTKDKELSMKSIRNLEDVPPVTLDSFLPGDKLQPGNIINIVLFGYVGYLFIASDT